MHRPLISLIFFLIFIQTVFAIGISPPFIKMDYQPGQFVETSVRVINYNEFPVQIELRSDGILASSFSVKQPITIPPQADVRVPISFRMPETLERPGHHTSTLYFKESYVDAQAGSFAVRTEVAFKIVLWQPYPGHYAEIVASAPSVGQGNDTVLKVVVNNLGVEPLENEKATVRVTSALGELRDVFTFNNINIPGNSNQAFTEVIRSRSYTPGRYTLAARLDYAENTSIMNGSFIIGQQDVDALAAEGPLYLDKPVNRFLLHIESLWNLPIDNVYATFELGSSKTQTPSVSLTPFGKNVLTGYWETDKTVSVGTPLARVIIYYPGGEKEALLPIQVFNETPKIIVPNLENPSVIELSAADILFMVLAIIIVVCITVFAIQKHRQHPQKPLTPPKQIA